ncbi:unnamed protein product [Urochloa decumbens]|uniref:Uncharacterized protein n=1 Tax=Urochloa decumbens TaxID=240449 RepID=A0ABC8XK18_9POAL
MASSQLGSYTAGSGARKMVRTGSGGGRSAAAMKQLLSKLRSTWRRSSGRPAASFGYDLQSYSLNFDDGHLGSSAGHHRFQTSSVIPCN